MPQASDDRLRRQRSASIVAPPPDRLTARAVAVTSGDGVRIPVAAARLSELAREVLAAEKVARALLSITMTSSREMARLNHRYLGHRGATDVITFAMGKDPTGVVIADIYICPDVAREQAREHGVGMREELARLVVHGVLHACGHEHPEEDRDQSKMWRRQESLLARLWTSRQHAV
jgi:probable rRNA maturation factor